MNFWHHLFIPIRRFYSFTYYDKWLECRRTFSIPIREKNWFSHRYFFLLCMRMRFFCLNSCVKLWVRFSIRVWCWYSYRAFFSMNFELHEFGISLINSKSKLLTQNLSKVAHWRICWSDSIFSCFDIHPIG